MSDSPLSSIVVDFELRSYALMLRNGSGIPSEGVMSPVEAVVVSTAPNVFRVDRADASAIDATAIFQIVVFGHPTDHWIAPRVHGLWTVLAECPIYDGHPLHGGAISEHSPFVSAARSIVAAGSAHVSFRIGLNRG